MICSLALALAVLFSAQTIDAQQQCVKLLSAGDWGTTTFGNELADWMDEVAGPSDMAGCSERASKVFLLGDNFYEWGVSSVTDSKWTEIYENPFSKTNLAQVSEHLAIMGNHDHYNILAGTRAQRDYTTKGKAGTKWRYPSDYYTREVNQNGVSIFLIFVETWDLVGGDSWLPFQEARSDSTQYRWIEDQLKSTKAQQADWRIVVGHYPVRTAMDSLIRGDTKGLVRQLEPLMKKYRDPLSFDPVPKKTKKTPSLTTRTWQCYCCCYCCC